MKKSFIFISIVLSVVLGLSSCDKSAYEPDTTDQEAVSNGYNSYYNFYSDCTATLTLGEDFSFTKVRVLFDAEHFNIKMTDKDGNEAFISGEDRDFEKYCVWCDYAHGFAQRGNVHINYSAKGIDTDVYILTLDFTALESDDYCIAVMSDYMSLDIHQSDEYSATKASVAGDVCVFSVSGTVPSELSMLKDTKIKNIVTASYEEGNRLEFVHSANGSTIAYSVDFADKTLQIVTNGESATLHNGEFSGSNIVFRNNTEFGGSFTLVIVYKR